METAKAISQSRPFAVKFLPADDLPPWEDSAASLTAAPVAAAPIVAANPPVRRAPPRAAARMRPLPQVEAVHWGVIVLMLFTVFNVLLGAFGGDEARPRELLPIVMVVTAP